MWIRYSALSAALILSSATSIQCAGQLVATSPKIAVPSDAAQLDDPRRMVVLVNGKRTVVNTTVDLGNTAPGRREVTLLLQRGPLALITDAIGSKPQGLHRCQAGHETYARVIDVRKRRELFAKLFDSCLVNQVLTDGEDLVVKGGRSVTFGQLYGSSFTITLNDNGTFIVKP